MNERIILLTSLWFQKYNSTDFKDSNAKKRVDNILNDCEKAIEYERRILKLEKAKKAQDEQIEKRTFKEYKLITERSIHTKSRDKIKGTGQ